MEESCNRCKSPGGGAEAGDFVDAGGEEEVSVVENSVEAGAGCEEEEEGSLQGAVFEECGEFGEGFESPEVFGIPELWSAKLRVLE